MSNYKEVMNTLKQVPGVEDHLSTFSVLVGKRMMQRRIALQMTRAEVVQKMGVENFTVNTLTKMELGADGIASARYNEVFKVLGLDNLQLSYK